MSDGSVVTSWSQCNLRQGYMQNHARHGVKKVSCPAFESFMSSVTRFQEASKDHHLLELVVLQLLDTTEQHSFDSRHLRLLVAVR